MGVLGRPRTYHPDRPATNTERSRARRQQQHLKLVSLEARLAKKVYHQSRRYDSETPWDVFQEYHAEFHFTLDVCASAQNSKCAISFTEADNGLAQAWGTQVCWMNPPYGKDLPLWMQKAYESSLAGATVVCLVPSRTGTRWWHDWVIGKGEVRLRKGRIRFVGYKDCAGFASVAVIYRPPSSLEAPSTATATAQDGLQSTISTEGVQLYTPCEALPPRAHGRSSL